MVHFGTASVPMDGEDRKKQMHELNPENLFQHTLDSDPVLTVVENNWVEAKSVHR